MIENPAVLQELRNFGWIGGKLEREGLRAIRFYIGAFQWGVIHEDETVPTQAQIMGQRFQVCGLWPPIEAPGREMLAAQRHVVALVEHFHDVVFVVLGAEAEKDSRFLLLPHEILQFQESGRKGHAFGPVFSANATPKS